MSLRAVSGAGDFLGAYTWAGLPAAASFAGYRARVTDYGVNLMVISDGTRWMPSGVQTLGRSGVASSVTGTTSETTLATVTVPANLLGINGALRITHLWSHTNSANNKTLKVKFGAASFFSATETTSVMNSTMTLYRNRGATNSQVGVSQSVGLLQSGSNPTTAAIDTTVDQSILFTGTLALGSELQTLESYTVEVLP